MSDIVVPVCKCKYSNILEMPNYNQSEQKLRIFQHIESVLQMECLSKQYGMEKCKEEKIKLFYKSFQLNPAYNIYNNLAADCLFIPFY